MAKDRKISALEEIENNYNVNQYTIRYDSKPKRFFKGFAPKVASGGVISAAVFAGLGVATLVTGGLAGVGVATIAGASVGAGALAQTVYSGVVYNRNSAKSRFKHLGIGGNEDSVGSIDIILECDKQAYEFNQILESQPSEKKFVVNGSSISRHALSKVAKEKEDIAYHGLKYILEQGLKLSEKINYLNKKSVLTENEITARENAYKTLDVIADCVREVASKRSNFNPYKNLIVGYISKGCMLGATDAQNKRIALIRDMKDKNMAFEQYSIMYEQPLKDELVAKRKTLAEEKKAIVEEQRKRVANNNEMFKLDTDINLLDAQKKTLEQLEATQKKLTKTQARYESSVRKRLTSRAQEREASKELNDTKAKLEREKKLHANATKRALAKRNENAELNDKNQRLQTEKDYATLFLEGAFDMIEGLEATIATKDAELRQMTNSRDTEKARADKYEGKNKRASNLIAQRIREYQTLQASHEMSEDARIKAEDNLYEVLADLYESKQGEQIAYSSAKQLETDLQASERRRKDVLKRAKKVVDKNKELTNQVDALTTERDALIEGQNANIATIMDLETDIRVATEQRDEVKAENKRLEQDLVDTGYELHKTRNEKAKIERDRDAYKAQTEDLMGKNTRLEDEKQELQDVADELLAEKQTKDYNFMRGSAMRRLNNLIAKVDAHIEYTKEERDNYNEDKGTKQAIDYLNYCITTLRTKSPISMSLVDITDAQKVLKVTYEAQRRNLAKISDKKLRELAKEQNSIRIDDKGLKR